MTIRKLAKSLGPYCLAAAVLPGGLIIAPLFFLLRRRNPAVLAAIQRVSSGLSLLTSRREFQKVRSRANGHVVGNWLAGSSPVSHERHTDYQEEL
jgi:hypothetical protein